MALSICTREFTIAELDGIDWDSLTWTLVDFFQSPPDSHSTGSVSGDTIQCACDGTPATSSGGLTVSGNLVYTGPLVAAKVTITGGPFSTAQTMAFSLLIDHSSAGNLLTVLRDDITTSPQDFLFVVPVSAAETITIHGGEGGDIAAYTQNSVGIISFTIVFDNQ